MASPGETKKWLFTPNTALSTDEKKECYWSLDCEAMS